MTIRITAVHLEGGEAHEHITQLRWAERETDKTGTAARTTVVDYIERGITTYVEQASAPLVQVYVVDPGNGRAKYLRTAADGVWTNNLLSLPRF